MAVNQKKSKLGKYTGRHGTIRMGCADPAAPVRGTVGKGMGKSQNFPPDSDAEFEKRYRRYLREKQEAERAEAEAAAAEAQDVA